MVSLFFSFEKKEKRKQIKTRKDKQTEIVPILNGENNFIPNDLFKNRVFGLINEGKSQGNAMRFAAKEFNVSLAPSYYKYPGSHVYRWKGQGFPTKTIF